MPAVSESQRRAAGAELGLRRNGKKRKKKRPFATATIAQLRDFARGGLRRGTAPVAKRGKPRPRPGTFPRLEVGQTQRLRTLALGRR